MRRAMWRVLMRMSPRAAVFVMLAGQLHRAVVAREFEWQHHAEHREVPCGCPTDTVDHGHWVSRELTGEYGLTLRWVER